MSGFFWISGHLGWGIFALLLFTGLWWLLSDLVWRLSRVRIRQLVVLMAGGWLGGFAVILLVFHHVSR